MTKDLTDERAGELVREALAVKGRLLDYPADDGFWLLMEELCGVARHAYRAGWDARGEQDTATVVRESMVGLQHGHRAGMLEALIQIQALCVLQCPECEHEGVAAPPVKYCGVCAGDCGRDVKMHRVPLIVEDVARKWITAKIAEVKDG